MNAFKIILIVAAGAVTGVIIGVLFAPYEGSETRRLIAEKGEELTEGVKHQFHRFGEFILEKLDGTIGGHSDFITTKGPMPGNE